MRYRASSTIARNVRVTVLDIIGSRAGMKTYAAVVSDELRELERRAKAYDKIRAAARRNDNSAADLAEVVYELTEGDN